GVVLLDDQRRLNVRDLFPGEQPAGAEIDQTLEGMVVGTVQDDGDRLAAERLSWLEREHLLLGGLVKSERWEECTLGQPPARLERLHRGSHFVGGEWVERVSLRRAHGRGAARSA